MWVEKDPDPRKPKYDEAYVSNMKGAIDMSYKQFPRPPLWKQALARIIMKVVG